MIHRAKVDRWWLDWTVYGEVGVRLHALEVVAQHGACRRASESCRRRIMDAVYPYGEEEESIMRFRPDGVAFHTRWHQETSLAALEQGIAEIPRGGAS